MFLPNGLKTFLGWPRIWRVVLLLAAVVLVGCVTTQLDLNGFPRTSHFDGSKFFNPTPSKPTQATSKVEMLRRFAMIAFGEKNETYPANGFDVPRLDVKAWEALDSNTIHLVRLGHSSILLKLHGKTWLIDPVFSQRTSPVQWLGPKRFHPVPVLAQDLPPIEGIIISHDHYDHLDIDTIRDLAEKVSHYVVPLGVGQRLQDWGIAKAKITELDWWQDVQIGRVRLVATPAQHFSGRSLSDRDMTLWASWVIESSGHGGVSAKIYYSGDSGYSADFKVIGDKFGPFDFALMETGAYNDMWPGVHMMPEETAQAFVDVRGKILIPVHNGTFDLAMHPWKEPFERITKIANDRKLPIATPEMGVVMSQGQAPLHLQWWANK